MGGYDSYVATLVLSIALPAAAMCAAGLGACIAYVRLSRRAVARGAWPLVRERVRLRGGAYRSAALDVSKPGAPTRLARAAAFVALFAAASVPAILALLFSLTDPERGAGMVVLVTVPAIACAVSHARAGAAILGRGPTSAEISLHAGLVTLLVALWVTGVAAAFGELSIRSLEPSVIAAVSFGAFLLGVAGMLVAASAHLSALRAR